MKGPESTGSKHARFAVLVFLTMVLAFLCAGNVGNLPMVLVAGLCHDAGLPLALPEALQPAAVCEARGISYVAFAMWVAGLFQFTVAYSLLKPKARCHPSFLLLCVIAELLWICILFAVQGSWLPYNAS